MAKEGTLLSLGRINNLRMQCIFWIEIKIIEYYICTMMKLMLAYEFVGLYKLNNYLYGYCLNGNWR